MEPGCAANAPGNSRDRPAQNADRRHHSAPRSSGRLEAMAARSRLPGLVMNQISTIAPAWICGNCGAGLDDACNSLGPNCRIDSERVIHSLERAGATLLAMRT